MLKRTGVYEHCLQLQESAALLLFGAKENLHLI